MKPALAVILACLTLGAARACDDQTDGFVFARDSVLVQTAARPAMPPKWDRMPTDLSHRLSPWQRVLDGVRREIEELNDGAARRKADREARDK